MSALGAAAPARSIGAPRRELRHLRLDGGWPLAVAFVGLPLWWILGLVQIVFIVVSIPMAVHLLRQRAVAVPGGFGTWLLFLLWISVGVFVLQVDAPGAVPGASLTRYPTFAFRMVWYGAGTITLLYIANTRRSLPTARIAAVLAAGFMVVTAGGWIGLLAPRFEFVTAVETMLPTRIASHPWVQSIVHARSAQVMEFVGRPQTRPSAPFAYTNDWGLAMALTLPFFLAEYGRRGGRWRWFTLAGLVAAVVPIVASLNRGLWGALGAMFVLVAVRAVWFGNFRVLLRAGAGLLVGALIVVSTPLGGLVAERFDNQHSNRGRANLGQLATESALEGSPVIGFGTTRNVPGNFNSISGGATADCPKCSPPSLGTQGLLWLLIFGGGVGALVLYAGYFAGQMRRHWRTPGPYTTAGLCTIVALFVTMPVYDAAGIGTLIPMVALGVLDRGRAPSGQMLGDLVRFSRRGYAIIALTTIVGLAGGVLADQRRPQDVTATHSILVPSDDLVGVPGVRPLTLDSEAMLARSAPVLHAIATEVGVDDWRLVDRHLTITAVPHSRILKLHYDAPDGATARAAVEAATAAYLQLRHQMINQAQDRLRTRLEQRERDLLALYAELRPVDGTDQAGARAADAMLAKARYVNTQISALESPRRSAGEAIGLATVSRSLDRKIIAVVSGGTIGLVVGLLAATQADRRRASARARPHVPPGALRAPWRSAEASTASASGSRPRQTIAA